MKRATIVLTLLITGALALTALLAIDYVQWESEREQRSLALGWEAGIRVATAPDGELFYFSMYLLITWYAITLFRFY